MDQKTGRAHRTARGASRQESKYILMTTPNHPFLKKQKENLRNTPSEPQKQKNTYLYTYTARNYLSARSRGKNRSIVRSDGARSSRRAASLHGRGGCVCVSVCSRRCHPSFSLAVHVGNVLREISF